MSLNGDRIVESMGGIVWGAVWKPWKEGRNVEEEGREGGSMGRVGKGEERMGGCGTEASLKELTGRQGARKGRGGAGQGRGGRKGWRSACT